MIADFYDTFDDEESMDIPQEVLEILNKALPENFVYYKDPEHGYVVGPRTDRITDKMILKVDFAPEALEQLKDIPKEKWEEYIYRTQMRVPVIEARIGNEEKQIPVEETLGNPLSTERKLADCFMTAQPFPDPMPITFETQEGEKVDIYIQQKPHPSLTKRKFMNVDFSAMKIEIYMADDGSSSRVTYSVAPVKAKTVSEAVTALHIFFGLYNGTVKIDGQYATDDTDRKVKFDAEILDSALDFWTTAQKLEKLLNVSFDPSAEFPKEDAEFFTELSVCLLENKAVKWEHPFDHFHINDVVSNEHSMDELFGVEGLSYRFIEGPVPATLLGAEFEIYSETEMTDFVMTNIVWDNEEKTRGELYITDSAEKKWKLLRKYRTKEQIEEKYGQDEENGI